MYIFLYLRRILLPTEFQLSLRRRHRFLISFGAIDWYDSRYLYVFFNYTTHKYHTSQEHINSIKNNY